MPSQYSIIQYVPNPIADERINIGVLAFDDKLVKVSFLKNWQRVKDFGGERIDFLQDFAKKMQVQANNGLLFPGDENNNTPKQDRLLRISNHWMNSIQFSEPRGSLKDVEQVLNDNINKFLVDINPPKQKRDRQAAAKFATGEVRKVVTERLGKNAQQLVKPDYSISGHYTQHKFDVAVANGKPYFVAQGISFEVKVNETLRNSISFMITDIKKDFQNLSLAIVALPPKPEQNNYRNQKKLYENTMSMYQELGAYVLEEDKFNSWIYTEISNLEKVCS
jgi:hypothetical protein